MDVRNFFGTNTRNAMSTYVQEPASKLCKKCNIEKTLVEMVKKQGSYRPECKECRNAAARKRSQDDPNFREKERLRGKEKYKKRKPQHLAITNRYYHENLPYRKDLHLRNQYGITMEDKIRMRESQKNCCGICHQEFPDDKSAYVDHCHTTGKVRGLLCRACNSILGFSRDSVEILQNAVGYLNSSNA